MKNSFYILLYVQIALISAIQLNIELNDDSTINNKTQTLFLFNKTSLNLISNQLLIKSSNPIECLKYFNLIETNQIVYLKWFKEIQESLITNCILQLNENIQLNVNLNNRILILNNQNELKLNVEYIFKVFNDSDYGLIKDDMTSNGIVSIVRLVYPRNDSIDLKISSNNNHKYFQVKKFLTNFYMIRLSSNTRELFDNYENINLELEAVLNETQSVILKSTLKFKIIALEELKIKFFEPEINELSLNLTEATNENNIKKPYGGFYVTRLNCVLNQKVFNNDAQLLELYKSNLRYEIQSSNLELNIFNLNPNTGDLFISVLDREYLVKIFNSEQIKFVLNITCYDLKKLFKTNYIKLNLNLIDLNDNKPKYSNSLYELTFNTSTLNLYNSIWLNEKKHYLIFNQTAWDTDYAENSILTYQILSVKLNELYQDYEKFYIEKLNGRVWLSEDLFNRNHSDFIKLYNIEIMVKDNSRYEFKYSIVSLSLKLVVEPYDYYVSESDQIDDEPTNSYLYEADLDCLIQIGQLNLGKIPIKFSNGILQLKLQDKYSKFFNLTINYDSKLRINLNENYLSNKHLIKNLNYIQTRLNYLAQDASLKSVLILIKFTNKNLFKFEKNFYEFNINENESKMLSLFDTNCLNMSEFRLISNLYFGQNLEKKFSLKRKLDSKNQIELWLLDKTDYELESAYEFYALSKCNSEQEDYLMLTKIRVLIIDVNDNVPIFINPVKAGQIIHKKLALKQLENDEKIFITQLKAFDSDRISKNSNLKYQIEQKLKKNSNCYDLFSLNLIINESNGELNVSIERIKYEAFKQCLFEIEVKATVFNYFSMNNLSESIQFDIKIELISESNLIWQKSLNKNSNKFYIDLNDQFLDSFQIEKCWINSQEVQNDYLISLNNHFLYLDQLKGNKSLEIHRLECKLSFIDNFFLQNAAWLFIYFDQEDKKNTSPKFNNLNIYIEINKNELFIKNNYLTKIDHFNETDSSEEFMIVYQMSELNEKFLNKYFKLDSLNSDLRTGTDLEEYFDIIEHLDLINFRIDVFVYDMSYSNKLIKKTESTIFLSLIQTPVILDQLETKFKELNWNLFNKTLTYLNETKILSLGKNNLQYLIQSVEEISFETSDLENNQLNLNTFEIIEIEEEKFLTLNQIGLETINKFYLIELKICINKPTKSIAAFVKDCKQASFNLKLDFKLVQDQIEFKQQVYNFDFFQIENFYFDEKLNLIDFTKPLIDLKKLILGSNIIDMNLIKFKTDLNLLEISSSNFSSRFFLDESNGLIYTRDLNFNKTSFKIFLGKNSNCFINIQIIKIKTEFNKTVLLYSNQDQIELIDLLEISLFKKINRSNLVVKCSNIESKTCAHMFNYIKNTNQLILNKTTINKISSKDLNLVLKYYQNGINLFDLKLNLKFKTQKKENFIDTNLVYFINTTDSYYKLNLIHKAKLSNDFYLDIVRVKNMITNTQVLALDYRLLIDDNEFYSIEFSDVLSLETNQLYSFDLIVRLKENNLISEQFFQSSIYLTRFNPFNSKTSPIQVYKKYYNIAGLNSLKINLTQLDQDDFKNEILSNNQFIQKYYLLNKIESNSRISNHLYNLEYDQFSLDLTQEFLADFEFRIKIFKFLIDKISLEILKISEYEFIIETFDWNYKKPSINLPEYFAQVKKFKSDLLKIDEKVSRKIGYDYLVYDFNSNQSEYELNSNLIEFSIDYLDDNNLPFEIGKYDGKVYYLISEDRTEYDTNFQKEFKFQIILKDLNNKKVGFEFNFLIVDDDPLVQLENLKTVFFINQNLAPNQFIGSVDLIESIENNYLNNLTTIYEFLKLKTLDLNFQIEENDMFYLDSKTGLLFAKKFVNIQENKIHKFDVKITGTVFSKNVIFNLDVVIIVDNLEQQSNAIPNLNKQLKFESNKFFFNTKYAAQNEKIQLKYFNSNQNTRFKLLFRSSNECEINWFNGQINCLFEHKNKIFKSFTKKIFLTAIVYDLNLLNDQNFDFTQVEISVYYAYKDDFKQIQDLDSKQMSVLRSLIEISHETGDVILNIYDLIFKTYQFKLDSNLNRVYLIINEEDTNTISFYFNLNKKNGDLTLKNRMIPSNTSLKQYLKLATVLNDPETDSTFIKTLKIFKLELQTKLQEYKFINPNCDFKVDYNILNRNIFVDIGKIDYKFKNKDKKLFFESYETIKSFSNKYSLILTNKNKFAENLDSYLFIDSSSGYISLNTTKFKELNLYKLNFYVSALNNYELIESRYECSLKIEFNSKLQRLISYFGYQTKKILIDSIIDLDSYSLGHTILDINKYLFKKKLNDFDLKFEIDMVENDFNFPFKIDYLTGKLFLYKHIQFNKLKIYGFEIKINNIFKIGVRIRLKSNKKIEKNDINLCDKASIIQRKIENDFEFSTNEYPEFDRDLYELDIKIQDFTLNKPIFRINAFYSNASYLNKIVYSFTQTDSTQTSGIVSFFQSILFLNEMTGELEFNLNYYNKYLKYCLNRNKTTNDHLNILLNVKAYNQYDHFSYATSLIKINPNCDGIYLDPKFNQEYYFIVISKKHEIDSLIYRNIYILNINENSYDVNFDLIGENQETFKIDSKTGEISLIKNIQSERYEFKLNAILKNKATRKSILLETKFIVFIQDFKTQIPTIGKIQNEVFSQEIRLELPIDNSGLNKYLKLFNFVANNTNEIYSMLSTSSNIFTFNSSNGWLLVNKEKILSSDNNQVHNLELIVLNKNEPYLKSKPLRLLIKTNKYLEIPKMNLYLNSNIKTIKKLVDLKEYFPESYKFLLIESYSNENFLYINKTDYAIYSDTKNEINSDNVYKFNLKYFTVESEFVLRQILVNFDHKVSNKQSRTEIYESVNIFLSDKTEKNSIIFDLNIYLNESTSFYKTKNLNHSLIILDSTHTKLVLKQSLIDLHNIYDNDVIQIILPIENYKHDLKLNVYITENLINNLKFDKLIYYFKHEAKMYELNKFKSIGEINVQTNDQNTLSLKTLNSIVQFETLELNNIVCKDENYLNENTFKIIKSNKIEILINNQLIFGSKCDLYSFEVELKIKNSLRTIKSLVYVNITNLEEANFLNLVQNQNSTFKASINTNTNSKTYYNINFYDLIQFNKDSSSVIELIEQFKDKSLVQDYFFNPNNGILSFNLNHNLTLSFHKINFNFVLKQNLKFFKIIKLDLFISNGLVIDSKEKKFYFNKKFINYEFNLEENSKINILDYLVIPKKSLRGTGLILEQKSIGFNPFEIDQLMACLSINKEIFDQTISSFINFTSLIEVSICEPKSNNCDSAYFLIRFINLFKSQHDYLNEYYKDSKLSIEIDLNFQDFNRDLFRLRHFGDLKNKFNLYKPSMNLIEIDYSTGWIFLNNDSQDLFKLEKVNFLIIYNNSIFIEFNIKLKDKLIDIKSRDNLIIDFVYKTINKQKKQHSNYNFIGNLAPIESKQYFNCQLWKASNQNLKLAENCDLYLDQIELDNSPEQISFIIRAYDLKTRFKSLFYNVKINKIVLNKTEADLDNQSLFLEFKMLGDDLNQNIKLIADFYKYLKLKLNLNLIDYKRIELNNQKMEVFLLHSNQASSLSKLKTTTELIEQNFDIKILNIFLSNTSENYKILNTDLTNNFKPLFTNLIDQNDLILNVPENMKIFHLNQPCMFKKKLKFEKLSFVNYNNLNFSRENFFRIKFLFKLKHTFSDQFLFYSKIGSNYIICEIVKNKIEIKHNLTNLNDKLDFSIDLESSVWYQIDIEITENQLITNINKWDSKFGLVNINNKIVINIKNINQFFINSLYIGGTDLILEELNSFYSDDIEIADFEINSMQIFNNLKNFISNSTINNKNNNNLELRMKKNYYKFTSIEKSLYENRINDFNSFIKGYNLSLKFKLKENFHTLTEVILLKTKNSEIVLSFLENRINFFILNELKAWVDLNESIKLIEFNQLEIFIKPGLIKISLNHNKKEFNTDLEISNFDLFTANYLIKEQNSICIKDVYINDNSIFKYYNINNNSFLHSCESYTPTEKNSSDNLKDLNIIKTDLDTKNPNPLIITILITSIFAIGAILSIILSILIRKRNQKVRNPNIANQINSESNINFADSKFNSRNPLEISVNTSHENSPVSSTTSSISGLTNSHSLGRQTIINASSSQNKITNENQQPNSQECYLNCSTLKIERLQENYFVYDSNQIKYLNPINRNLINKNENDPNSVFNLTDLERIKSVLNWVPTCSEFSNVLNEFEKFQNNNHLCSNEILLFNSNLNNQQKNILDSINFYDQYDKQTFV